MKEQVSLDDLSLFVAVADAGGLSGAVRSTGVSAPTLSRRMVALETRLGCRLFSRGAQGYALTGDGRALLDRLSGVRALAAEVARFGERRQAVRVRITAGFWTSQFLAQNISRFWSPSSAWVPEFVATNMAVDIARREADIGIRNRRPTQSWLAAQRTQGVTYAPFARDPSVTGWIAAPKDALMSASQSWIYEHHADQIVTICNDPRLAMDLALSGVGKVVMPTFAARETILRRVGPDIADLAHHAWVVCHHDARHDAPIRAALDQITAVLTDPAHQAGSRQTD